MPTTKYIIEIDDEPKKVETCDDICYSVVGFKDFYIAQCTRDKLKVYVPPLRTFGYNQGVEDGWGAFLDLYGSHSLCKRLFGDKPFNVSIFEADPLEIIKKIKQAKQESEVEKQKLFKMFQYVIGYEEEWDNIRDLLNEIVKDIHGETYEEVFGVEEPT